MTKQKISIVTPNYNYARFIGQTIESIVTQTYDNWEYIIVDDGSTDNSVEVINKYLLAYPGKIKLIQQENQGQTKAINKALSYVTGDIIGWINSDDMFADNVFQHVIDTFGHNTSLDAVFGDIVIINKEGQTVKKNSYLKFDYASGVFNGFGKIISSNAIFWKKKLTDESGKMKEDFIYAMDAEYWSRLLYKKNVRHIPVVFSQFRWHDEAKTIIRKGKNSKAYNKAKEEDYFIFCNSYTNLKISKILPSKYTFPLKFYFKLKRYFLRLINGHYFNG